MTVVVTRNVEERVRGFLASTMLEIAGGVYTSPTLSAAVRERVWAVLAKWNVGTHGAGVVMTWPDSQAPGGQAVRILGEPPLDLQEIDGVVLSRRDLSDAEARSLRIKFEDPPF
ncbi:MAG TPA: type I-E CRISPR-associated endoribonuclease Cas2e [Polyangiaceae bacterium]